MDISLIINGQEASLKKGSSIEYVSENRIFTDADDYSMEIELPVGYFSHARQCSSKLALRSLNRKSAECPQNIAIFGHLTRKDIDTDKNLWGQRYPEVNRIRVGESYLFELVPIKFCPDIALGAHTAERYFFYPVEKPPGKYVATYEFYAIKWLDALYYMPLSFQKKSPPK